MAATLTPANSHLYCVGAALPNTANPFSINVWLNATWNGGARLSFVGMYDGTPATGTPTTGAGLQIGTSTGAGEVSCWIYGGTIVIQSTTATLTAFNGQWVMLTYVWDGTNHRLYLNGASTATATTTAFTAKQMTQVYINGYPPTGTTNETAAFSVDSYSTFNRALSAAEILTMYNAQGARSGNVYGLACRYEFDEGVAATAITAGIDVSGTGQTIAHTGGTNTTTYTYSGTVANSNTRPVQ